MSGDESDLVDDNESLNELANATIPDEPVDPVDQVQPSKKTEGPYVAFVFEIDIPNNCNILWQPTQELLRGKFDLSRAKSGGEPDPRISRTPVTPGLCIQVDSRRRLARIFDPLSQNSERAKQLLAKLQATMLQAFGQRVMPVETKEYHNLSNDALKLWTYWARRLDLVGHCRVLQGTIPDEATINEMPGRIEANLLDPGRNGGEFRDSLTPARKRPELRPDEDLVIDPNQI